MVERHLWKMHHFPTMGRGEIFCSGTLPLFSVADVQSIYMARKKANSFKGQTTAKLQSKISRQNLNLKRKQTTQKNITFWVGVRPSNETIECILRLWIFLMTIQPAAGCLSTTIKGNWGLLTQPLRKITYRPPRQWNTRHSLWSTSNVPGSGSRLEGKSVCHGRGAQRTKQ